MFAKLPAYLVVCAVLTAQTPLEVVVCRHDKVPASEVRRAVALSQKILNDQRLPIHVSLLNGSCQDSASKLCIEIRDVESERRTRHALGVSHWGGGQREHALVRYAAVERWALQAVVDVEPALAYTLLHEAAHLITHSAVHDSGIMQDEWSRREIKMIQQQSLPFSNAYLSLLRSLAQTQAIASGAAGAREGSGPSGR